MSTPSPRTANAPASGPDSGVASGQLPPDPLEATTGTPSASDPAGDDAKPLNLKKRPLGEVFRGLVLTGSKAAHNMLARSPLEREHGVWLMEGEDEAAGIADPLASIAQRHAGGAVVNGDTQDLIQAGVALAGYIIGNLIKTFDIRRAERQMRRAGINPTGETQREEQQQ